MQEPKTERKTWKEICLCHAATYGALSACHGWAAWATGKPEVYVPMMVIYALQAWRG
ncbi:hypothetical protein JANAI61_10200 [Jannaschia sp. AI_61]|nr:MULTISPECIES: hypothetical protein [unclassified Jannaschia]GIT90562.1 hypothetical protein JANAI61_10200 [Jannaschia sp. AI_61]